MDNNFIKEEIIYKTYDELFELFKSKGFSVLERKLGTSEYPELHYMLEYFEENEEYEKCSYISKIQKPIISPLKIEREKEFLRAILE